MELSYVQTVKSSDYWSAKGYGAVFVKGAENIKEVYNALVEQDDYWETESGVNNLIKVLPENADPRELRKDIQYVSKQEIDDVESLEKKLKEKGIDIFIIWEPEQEWN